MDNFNDTFLLQPLVPKSFFLDERRSSLASIIVAVVYGLICMSIALIAVYFRSGVLQISLTVFSVVGGPLLALFSLGMLCRIANQKVCYVKIHIILDFRFGVHIH